MNTPKSILSHPFLKILWLLIIGVKFSLVWGLCSVLLLWLSFKSQESRHVSLVIHLLF